MFWRNGRNENSGVFCSDGLSIRSATDVSTVVVAIMGVMRVEDCRLQDFDDEAQCLSRIPNVQARAGAMPENVSSMTDAVAREGGPLASRGPIPTQLRQWYPLT